VFWEKHWGRNSIISARSGLGFAASLSCGVLLATIHAPTESAATSAYPSRPITMIVS
jgi:hypothetical protein